MMKKLLFLALIILALTTGCPWEEQPGEEPADLAITDVWSNEGEIWYTVKNQCGYSGPVGAQLRIDGIFQALDFVDDLGPWEETDRKFPDYIYSCSGSSDNIEVEAWAEFALVQVAEEDRTYSTVWQCPAIEPGPGPVPKPDLTPLVPQFGLPDLAITDIILVGHTISCRIKNNGPVKPPHEFLIDLEIDGVYKDSEIDLIAGASDSQLVDFDLYYQCTGRGDTIKVTVDPSNYIKETTERNNVRYESWNCTEDIIYNPLNIR
jgi:subtilase family serine protease